MLSAAEAILSGFVVHSFSHLCADVQILGQAKDPAVIQAHLKKLFAGVHGVTLTDDKGAITAALSIESEQVQLAAPVVVSEQVDTWLQSLLVAIQSTLQVQHAPRVSACLKEKKKSQHR